MIASIFAVASTGAFLTLWFWVVHRELKTKVDTVNSAWSQLSACQKRLMLAKDEPDETEKLQIYIRSRDIYLQSLSLYNQTLQKPWNRIPGFLLGFRQIRDGEYSAELSERVNHLSTQTLLMELANLAFYDHLTGLPNRILFKERVNQAIFKANRTKKIFGLLFLDLDNFKEVNDTWGHAVGDQLLKETAQLLNNCVRKSDTVARFGGDEFLILVNDLSYTTDITKVADKILAQLNNPLKIGEREVCITVSCGIAVYPEAGEDTGTLIKNADLAMYKAKEKGKNQYAVHSSYIKRKGPTTE